MDLYYRLSVIQIDIPSLRERGDDVLLLTDHYIESFGKRLRKHVHAIAPDVAAAFRRYEWPGNVRELRNVIERALILEDGDVITMKYVPRAVIEELKIRLKTVEQRGGVPAGFRLPTDGISLDDVEMGLVKTSH